MQITAAQEIPALFPMTRQEAIVCSGRGGEEGERSGGRGTRYNVLPSRATRGTRRGGQSITRGRSSSLRSSSL